VEWVVADIVKPPFFWRALDRTFSFLWPIAGLGTLTKGEIVNLIFGPFHFKKLNSNFLNKIESSKSTEWTFGRTLRESSLDRRWFLLSQ